MLLQVKKLKKWFRQFFFWGWNFGNIENIENVFWETKPPFLPERIIFKNLHLIDVFIFFVWNLYAYFSRYPSNRDVHRQLFFLSLYNGLFKPSFILKVLLLWSDFFYYSKTWYGQKYRFEYVTEKHLPFVYLLSSTEVKWQTLPGSGNRGSGNRVSDFRISGGSL